MKYIVFFFFINTVSAQFNFDDNCKACSKNIKTKASKTSLWLGQISPFASEDNRFTIDVGISLYEKNNYLPNLSNSLKVAKNLTFISKIYSFNHDNNSPQIYGFGIMYAPKSDNGANWISILQKVNLRGLSDYRLSTITMGISKVIFYKIGNIHYGFGAVFYDQKSYKIYEDVPKKIESQINFMHISGSTKIKNLQFETKISTNFNISIFSFIIKKGII